MVEAIKTEQFGFRDLQMENCTFLNGVQLKLKSAKFIQFSLK